MSCRGCFVGAVTYADEIILISASYVKLQQMLQLCESFGVKCDLKFNVVKSCVGYVSSSVQTRIQFLLEGRVLPWVDGHKYLDITFVVGKGYHSDCSERVRKFIVTVSSVLGFNIMSVKFLLDRKTMSSNAMINSINNALINKLVKCRYSVRQASFALYGLSVCKNVSGIKRSVHNAFCNTVQVNYS